MAEQGAVSRMFQRKGQIIINKNQSEEDALMEIVLDSGAEDLKVTDTQYEVLTDPSDFDIVSDVLTKTGIDMESSEITLIPTMISEVNNADQARSIMKFIDALEEIDDVQDVYSNFDISDEVAKIINEEIV